MIVIITQPRDLVIKQKAEIVLFCFVFVWFVAGQPRCRWQNGFQTAVRLICQVSVCCFYCFFFFDAYLNGVGQIYTWRLMK